MGGEYIQVDWWLYYWHVVSAWIVIGLSISLVLSLLIEKLLVSDANSIKCSPKVEKIVQRFMLVNIALVSLDFLLMFIIHLEW